MASSKLELLKSPPSASLSSDGEESSSEEITPLPKPAPKKPQSSDSDSEPEPEPVETVPEPVVKPQALDQKKPKSTAAKRPAETERGGKEPKRAKHAAAEKTTPRLWSEEEEVALLKGMVDYEVKIGLSPSGDMDAFHAFVKKSLHMDASRSQVYEKLRRLKKKYWDNVEKLKRDGAASSSWKHHDKKLFELSKKIWGNEADGLQSPNKVKSTAKSNKEATPKLPPKNLETSLTPSVDGAKEDEEETETEPEKNLVPLTSLADNQRNLAQFMTLAAGKSPGDMQEFIILEGLKLVTGPQKAEFEERWAKLKKEELELYVEQSKLLHEQAKIVMEAKAKK